MTHQNYLWQIDEAARDAAQASFDAHGEAVPAGVAWDFLRTVYAETYGELYGYMESLPEVMPVPFFWYYLRHSRLIQNAKEKI